MLNIRLEQYIEFKNRVHRICLILRYPDGRTCVFNTDWKYYFDKEGKFWYKVPIGY